MAWGTTVTNSMWRSMLRLSHSNNHNKTRLEDEEQDQPQDTTPSFFSLGGDPSDPSPLTQQDVRHRMNSLFHRGVISTVDSDRLERIDNTNSPARQYSFQKAINDSTVVATTSGEYPGSLWSMYQSELSDSESLSSEEDRRPLFMEDQNESDDDILRKFELFSPWIDYSSDDESISISGTIDVSEWKKVSQLSSSCNVKKLSVENAELCRDDAKILQQILEDNTLEVVTLQNMRVGGEDAISPFVRVPVKDDSGKPRAQVEIRVGENRATEVEEERQEERYDPYAQGREGFAQIPRRKFVRRRPGGDRRSDDDVRACLAPSVRIWRRLLKAMRENECITNVTLDNVNIDDRSKYYLFQFISMSDGLKSFAIRNTTFSDGIVLSQALFGRSSPLEELDIRNNPISADHLSMLCWAASVDETTHGSNDRRELYDNLIRAHRGHPNELLFENSDCKAADYIDWDGGREPGQNSEPGSRRRLCSTLTFHRPEGWNDSVENPQYEENFGVDPLMQVIANLDDAGAGGGAGVSMEAILRV